MFSPFLLSVKVCSRAVLLGAVALPHRSYRERNRFLPCFFMGVSPPSCSVCFKLFFNNSLNNGRVASKKIVQVPRIPGAKQYIQRQTPRLIPYIDRALLVSLFEQQPDNVRCSTGSRGQGCPS